MFPAKYKLALKAKSILVNPNFPPRDIMAKFINIIIIMYYFINERVTFMYILIEINQG